MIARACCRVATFLAIVCAPAAAGAKMVSAGDCRDLTRDCTCSDAPYMSVYLDNQQDALAAWGATQLDIAVEGAAKSFEDARNLFHSKFPGDPRVLEPFAACPNFDATKIAGNSLLGGGAELNDCFCKNVCRDIVEATIAHERTHVAFNLLGIAYIIDMGTVCKLGLVDQSLCDVSDALLLSESEIQAHEAGNKVLSDALDKLRDPSPPAMACTWEPLPASSPREIPPPPAPAGFFARLAALGARFLHGATAP